MGRLLRLGSELDAIAVIASELFGLTNVRILVCLVKSGTIGLGATLAGVTWRGSASSSPGNFGTLALHSKSRRFLGRL